jgi:NADH-quinone oxidoreductase subunit G
MNNRKLFNDKDELESSMFNFLKLQKEKEIVDSKEQLNSNFQNEKLNIQVKDYYFSNVIARSSKTMIECDNSKLNLKSTGTEG